MGPRAARWPAAGRRPCVGAARFSLPRRGGEHNAEADGRPAHAGGEHVRRHTRRRAPSGPCRPRWGVARSSQRRRRARRRRRSSRGSIRRGRITPISPRTRPARSSAPPARRGSKSNTPPRPITPAGACAGRPDRAGRASSGTSRGSGLPPTARTARCAGSGAASSAARRCCARACGGYLWQLERSDGGVWSKTACGTVDTSEDVFMFGFDEKLYLLNGSQYRVWDGESLTDVAGYRPLVAVSAPPEGGGHLARAGQQALRAEADALLPRRERHDLPPPRAGGAEHRLRALRGLGRRPHELRGRISRTAPSPSRPPRPRARTASRSAGRWAPIPPPRCAPCAARSSITASRTRAYSSTATGAAAASTPA